MTLSTIDNAADIKSFRNFYLKERPVTADKQHNQSTVTASTLSLSPYPSSHSLSLREKKKLCSNSVCTALDFFFTSEDYLHIFIHILTVSYFLITEIPNRKIRKTFDKKILK